MTTNKSTRQSDAEDLLMEAIEVQLAALRAGIEFWSTWVEQSTKFSEEAIKRLTEIKANPAESSRLLLEITDSSRESLRAMRQENPPPKPAPRKDQSVQQKQNRSNLF